MRGEGGIVVDSYLSYPDEVGNDFIATAEATSVDTRDEVKYTVQFRLLFWDSLVFGTLVSILFFFVSTRISFLSMPGINPLLRILVLVGSIVFFTVLYHSGIRPLRRYRYIYAIAQFKKYHANEQWVALARGVFPMLDENTYYRELKRQCTRFGFGLILIDKERQARMILSPSREEQFDRQRRQIRLLSLSNYRRLQDLTRQDWWLMNWWNRWTNPYREHDYFRFKSGFNHQLSLIGLGLVILSVLFLRELKRMPVYYPNESRYEKRLEKETEKPATAEDANDPRPFVVPFGDSLTDENVMGLDTITAPEIIPLKPQAEVMVYDPYNQTIIFYDCARMYNFTETKYLIEIGAFGDQAQAQDRLQILGDAGINGIVFWEGCFSPNREAFILYVETMYDTLEEAQVTLDSLQDKLLNAKLRPQIKPISPVTGR